MLASLAVKKTAEPVNPHLRLSFSFPSLRHGMQAVTTRQIAAAVGVSQPSLYAFFPNKQALEAEVCTRAFEELTSRTTAGLAALKRGGSETA